MIHNYKWDICGKRAEIESPRMISDDVVQGIRDQLYGEYLEEQTERWNRLTWTQKALCYLKWWLV